MQHTSYQPAVHRISTADPWPTPNYDRIMAYGRAWFQSTCRPARPFPAANFCPLSARPKPKTIRISTEHLPVQTLSQWREEQEDLFAFFQSPWPGERKVRRIRRKGWLEHQVDKILAWQKRRRIKKQEVG